MKEFTLQTIRGCTNIKHTSMAGTTSSTVRSIRITLYFILFF